MNQVAIDFFGRMRNCKLKIWLKLWQGIKSLDKRKEFSKAMKQLITVKSLLMTIVTRKWSTIILVLGSFINGWLRQYQSVSRTSFAEMHWQRELEKIVRLRLLKKNKEHKIERVSFLKHTRNLTKKILIRLNCIKNTWNCQLLEITAKKSMRLALSCWVRIHLWCLSSTKKNSRKNLTVKMLMSSFQSQLLLN